ncbi:MAG: hypothetical protein LAO19_09345 [Acidobacteriia bacterium]|nr:hypothetical protein [Terriglobia bacterium]
MNQPVRVELPGDASGSAMIHLTQFQYHFLGKAMGARKHKRKKFTAGGEARRRARELAGPPPAARVIPDKRLKPPKHKGDLLQDEK